MRLRPGQPSGIAKVVTVCVSETSLLGIDRQGMLEQPFKLLRGGGDVRRSGDQFSGHVRAFQAQLSLVAYQQFKALPIHSANLIEKAKRLCLLIFWQNCKLMFIPIGIV